MNQIWYNNVKFFPHDVKARTTNNVNELGLQEAIDTAKLGNNRQLSIYSIVYPLYLKVLFARYWSKCRRCRNVFTAGGRPTFFACCFKFLSCSGRRCRI